MLTDQLFTKTWIIGTVLAFTMTGHSLSVSASEQPAVEVEIIKFQFLPQEITIEAGDMVRWTNREKRQYHSVWFEQAGDPEADYIFPDETYQRTFDKPGSFPYRCGPHPKMTGIVHVK